MTTYRTVATACLATLAMLLAAPSMGAAFVDVLDTAAQPSPLASRTLLQAVAKAGSRLVAVGPRGHIVVSSDRGTTWKQAPVPVSSDLTAVYFADSENGWAVGHDGVVLHSANGGQSWQVQLNGHKANDLLLTAMEAKAKAEPASADPKRSATRSRAPTSRSSTSGLPTPPMATSLVRTTSSSAPPTAARPGSRGSIGLTTPGSSISTRSARPAVTSISQVKAGSC
jgi:hypothetical protein